MAVNRRRIDRELEEIYAGLPTVACKGLCAEACGPIPMTGRERERADTALGEPVSATLPTLTCNALRDRRCSIYEDRPLICRLWGVVEGMQCTHGCTPTRLLTDAEAGTILARAQQIAGADDWLRIAGVLLPRAEAIATIRSARRRLA